MRLHHTIGLCVAAGSVVLGACHTWRAARETPAAAPRVLAVWRDDAATGRFEISSGALVRRHEVQAELDAARDALGVGAPADAAAPLRVAARFYAGHAAAPGAGAREPLAAAAARLVRLADTLAAGGRVTAADVVAASRAANLAEAEHHRVAAAVAWTRWQRSDAGDELVMAVDHVERALADGGESVTPATRRVLATAREEGCTLMRDGAADAARVDRVLAGLGTVIATR